MKQKKKRIVGKVIICLFFFFGMKQITSCVDLTRSFQD